MFPYLTKKNYLNYFDWVCEKRKKINSEIKIKENKKIKINKPLSGSFAKV